MGKQRIEYFDIAKGIAIISVIVGHLGISLINRFVFTYHLPLFLFITGYFINDKKSIKEFARTRIRSLMLPYVVTCVLIILLGTLKGALKGDALSELSKWSFASMYGSGLDYTEPFYIPAIGAIWYLPASCLGAILLRCTLSSSSSLRPFIIIVLFAIGYFTTKFFFWFPLSIQSGLCCVFFMYMGWFLRKYITSENRLEKELSIGAYILLIAMWVSFIINYQGFSIVENLYGRGIVDIISAVCASIVIVQTCRNIGKSTNLLKRILLFAGKYSLLVLCVHIVELDLFPWEKTITLFFSVSSQVYSWILFFLKPAVILLVTWILLKMKCVRVIFGYE